MNLNKLIEASIGLTTLALSSCSPIRSETPTQIPRPVITTPTRNPNFLLPLPNRMRIDPNNPENGCYSVTVPPSYFPKVGASSTTVGLNTTYRIQAEIDLELAPNGLRIQVSQAPLGAVHPETQVRIIDHLYNPNLRTEVEGCWDQTGITTIRANERTSQAPK